MNKFLPLVLLIILGITVGSGKTMARLGDESPPLNYGVTLEIATYPTTNRWAEEMIVSADRNTAALLYDDEYIYVVDLIAESSLLVEYPDTSFAHMALDPTGNLIFVATPDALYTIEVASNTILSEIPLSALPRDIAAFSEDEVLLLVDHVPLDELLLLNPETGEISTSWQLEADFNFFEIASNEPIIYLAQLGAVDPKLYQVEIMDGMFNTVAETDLTTWLDEVVIAPANDFILALDADDRFLRITPDTLVVEEITNIPAGRRKAVAIAPDSLSYSYLYAADGNLSDPDGIRTFDTETHELIVQYEDAFGTTSSVLAYYDVNRIMSGVVRSGTTNMVQLLEPLDEFNYLSNLTYFFCPQPIFDSFDDPTSGWPSGEIDGHVFGYNNGTYLIDPASGVRLWVDSEYLWQIEQEVAIDGWIPNGRDGWWGVIYGYNRGNGSFSTFEISPNEQRHRISHYHPATGWSLGQSSSSDAINLGNQVNRIRLSHFVNFSGDKIAFYINGAMVDFAPHQNGYVGLSTLGYFGSVYFRFDNFAYGAHTCPITQFE